MSLAYVAECVAFRRSDILSVHGKSGDAIARLGHYIIGNTASLGNRVFARRSNSAACACRSGSDFKGPCVFGTEIGGNADVSPDLLYRVSGFVRNDLPVDRPACKYISVSSGGLQGHIGVAVIFSPALTFSGALRINGNIDADNLFLEDCADVPVSSNIAQLQGCGGGDGFIIFRKSHKAVSGLGLCGQCHAAAVADGATPGYSAGVRVADTRPYIAGLPAEFRREGAV